MKMDLQLFGGRGGGSGLGSGGGKMGIAEIRANEHTREIFDSIEEAYDEIVGRGIDMNDDSEFWVHAYKEDVRKLYNETGFDYDKSVEKQETGRRAADVKEKLDKHTVTSMKKPERYQSTVKSIDGSNGEKLRLSISNEGINGFSASLRITKKSGSDGGGYSSKNGLNFADAKKALKGFVDTYNKRNTSANIKKRWSGYNPDKEISK